MRICLVAPLVAPLRAAQAGGAQAVLSELARRLAERGEEVEIVAAPGSRVVRVPVRTVRGAPFPEALVHIAASEIAQPAPTSPAPATGQTAAHSPPDSATPAARPAQQGAANSPPPESPPPLTPAAWPAQQAAAYLQVAAHVRDIRPAIVHAHALDWPAFYALAATGIPTVHTLHLGPIDPAAAAAARAAAGSAAPRARFVAVSRATAQQWRGIVLVAAVIGNGADPDSIPFDAHPQPNLALVAGRIAPEKGTDLAIAAALQAGMRVQLAGDVYDRAYFEARVAPLLGPRVEHLGPVPRRRLAQLYGRAAVAVVASLWEEPFGMVALEANLAGTPVAGFRKGALPEVVGAACGVLTEHTDVDSLAAAITSATRLDRHQVRREAASRHPLDRMVDRYVSLYRTVVQEERERARKQAAKHSTT